MASTKKSVVFRGIHVVGIDDKGRMAMPAKYRKDLTTYCRGELIVTLDRDGCLLIYPAGDWRAKEKDLLALPAMNPGARFVQRLMVGHATDCTMDKQGRLLLPPALRDVGGIAHRSAVLLGQGNKFELWDEKVWAQRRDAWLEETRKDQAGFTDALEGIRL